MLVVGYGDNSGHILGVREYHATDSLDPSPPSIHNKHATCHPHQGSNLPILWEWNPLPQGKANRMNLRDVGFLTKSISVALYMLSMSNHISIKYKYTNIRYLIYIYI